MSPAWRSWEALPAGHALVALGSNLGAREAHLEGALEELAALAGVELLERSTWHTTAPVGGPAGQGAFLNGAALLRCALEPQELLAELHRIEERHGRERLVPDGPRTLDLDLLFHGTQRSSGLLELPHPRLGERLFVLAPLAELCPELRLPAGGDTVRERRDALGSGAQLA